MVDSTVKIELSQNPLQVRESFEIPVVQTGQQGTHCADSNVFRDKSGVNCGKVATKDQGISEFENELVVPVV